MKYVWILWYDDGIDKFIHRIFDMEEKANSFHQDDLYDSKYYYVQRHTVR